MEFILWLERKWLQLSPEFEQWAQKYAQEIKEKRFEAKYLCCHNAIILQRVWL